MLEVRDAIRDAVYFVYYWIHQLFPFTYRCRYKVKGVKHFAVWRMWLGHCFDIDDVKAK